jgi:tRNA threonylcarbamoyladenosine biosynthesis protein TsaB
VLCLGVDTSTPAGSIALVERGRLVAELNIDSDRHHQGRLLRGLDLLLDLVGVDFSKVALLGVALGPGSFTALRVGIATVKGLSVARKIPAHGFSTLAALSWRFRSSRLPVAAMLEAGRGEVYGSVTRWAEDELVAILPERGESPERFIRSVPPGPVIFTGEGARLRGDLVSRLRGDADILDSGPYFLGAALAEMAGSRHERGAPWSLGNLKPNYIRPPDAELPRRP